MVQNHHQRHEKGANDPVTVEKQYADELDTTKVLMPKGDHGVEFAALAAGDLPAHATLHEDGGADEMTIENMATADTDVSRALRPDGAGGVAFSDVAHSDTTGKTADDHHNEDHQDRHNSGGGDALKLDDLAAPDDNTDLNASTSAHGLLPKLSNDSSQFLDGTGAFSTPATGGPTTAYKASDETITNSTTLQNDDDLVLAVGANEVWAFKIFMDITTGAAGDWKQAFTVPSGAGGTIHILFEGDGADDTSISSSGSAYSAQSRTITATLAMASSATRYIGQIHGVIINGANAGNLQLQWAQNASNGTATGLLAGSHLIAWQLA